MNRDTSLVPRSTPLETRVKKRNQRLEVEAVSSELVDSVLSMLDLSVLEIADAMDTYDTGAHTQHIFVLEAIAAVLTGIGRAGAQKHGDRFLR